MISFVSKRNVGIAFICALACALAGNAQAQVTVVSEIDTIGIPAALFQPTMNWHGQSTSEFWLSQNLDLSKFDLARSTLSKTPPSRDFNVRPVKRLAPLKPILLEPILPEPDPSGSQVQLASYERLSPLAQDDEKKKDEQAPSKKEGSDLDNKSGKQDQVPATTVIENEQSLKALGQQIKGRIELVTNAADDAEKEEKLRQLNSANVWIQKANTSQAYIDSQKAVQAKFDEDLKKWKLQLEEPLETHSPEPDMTSDVLQMKLQELRGELQKVKTQQTANQANLDQRDERISRLPADRIAAVNRLSKLKSSLANLEKQPNDPAKELSSLFLKAQEWAAKKELEALDHEAPRLDQTGKLLPIERDSINRQVQNLESEIKAFNAAYDLRRKQDIKDQEAEAQRLFEAAINADPVLREWAETNQDLAEQRSEWTAGIDLAKANKISVNNQWEEIKTTLDGIIKETETNITLETGITLIEKRNSLLRPGESQARILTIKAKLQDIRMLALKWKEDRKKLASTDQAVTELVNSRQHFHVGDGVTKRNLMDIESKAQRDEELTEAEEAIFETAGEEKVKFTEMARKLVTARIKYLDALDSDYELYRSALLSEVEERRSLVNQVTEMRNFIDEKALWIQSARRVNLTHFRDSARAAGSFFAPSGWTGLMGEFKQNIVGRPYQAGFGGIILIGLLAITFRLKVSHD